MPIYTWINEPPIVEIPLEDVQLAVVSFQRSLNDIKDNPGEYGEFSAAKARAAIDIADGFKNAFDTPFKRSLANRRGVARRVFGYQLDGLLVGLIDIAIRTDCVFIEHVVGHAGTENAGDILIEHVLQFSPIDPPVAKLSAAGEQPFNAYKKIGFVGDSGGSQTTGPMTLDLSRPPGSEKWTLVGGRYKLTSAVALGYMTNA
jgi:hypothetical protein